MGYWGRLGYIAKERPKNGVYIELRLNAEGHMITSKAVVSNMWSVVHWWSTSTRE